MVLHAQDELPFYVTEEERVVDIQGEPLKVLKALEAVVGHLRKFLVDHSILPLVEKSPNAPLVQAQAPVAAPWSDQAPSLIHTAQQSGMGGDYSFPLKRASLYLEHDSHLDSQIQRSGALSSFYRQEPPLSGLHSTGLGRSAAALVTQVAQTMQIPISYAEDIIGIGGANIAYIRRTSGAVLTAQESGGLHDEITVEIKGSSSQVQAAQQLIQDFMSDIKLDIKIQSDYSTHSDIKW
ncbi:RNA-binding KH domain-containing protein PEPPER-like isoform X2 [Asparagus officinalis]|uniref:RNA-binding KH domain-containing protein PEPPER-like isoform X2 n=1 Tax=Asparagus officinalis TaxID=4686 RepID=UPI00098DF2B2|nr:RNA-binding KH domain-containing protein PEPPER-like isoform X2 [Asparagus officinalis]